MSYLTSQSLTRLLLPLVFVIFAFCGNASAQTFTFNSREASERLTGDSMYVHGFSDTMIAYCDDWDSLIHHSDWRDRHKLKSNNTFIKFAIDKSSTIRSYSSNNFNYWLVYHLYGFNDPNDTIGGIVSFPQDTLYINYNDNTNNTPYRDHDIRKYSNFYKVMLVVDNILESNGAPMAPAALVDSVKRIFYVDASIVTQHYDKMHYGIVDSPLQVTSTGFPGSSDPDYVKLSWSYGGGLTISPANYELEWTYVNDYAVNMTAGSVGNKSTGALYYDFRNNSTRVWLSDNSYVLPRCHGSGYLVYRVRIVRPDSDLYEYPIYGPWSLSSGADSGVMSGLSSSGNDYDAITDAYMHDSLNWQFKASYAEGGKYVHTASFHDGLLKNRQSLSRTALPDKVIVTDNVYDFEGRPCIKTIPAPTGSNRFSFLQNVCLDSTSRHPLEAIVFDTGFAACPASIPLPPLDTTSLACIYYSPANPDTSDMFRSRIPDAFGFPLVQTVYEPGYNDRVSEQSGAGNQLRIRKPFLENFTAYDYVSPAQKDINALFGTTAGWAQYYNMTVTRDPNQQLSMVIKDYNGRQMASSLIGLGPNPANHALVPIKSTSAVFYMQDLLSPFSSGQTVDTISGTRVADLDFFNQNAATDSFLYSYTFQPFHVCSGLDIAVAGHYNSTITDKCGNIWVHEDTLLGSTGPVPPTPITFYSPSAFSADLAAYHVHKSLSFDRNDVDLAVASIDTATSCFYNEQHFIRQSVTNGSFPCAPSTADSSPCSKLKWQMMRQLLPGAAYGQYSLATGNVVGTTNSIFSLFCNADTTFYVDSFYTTYNCYNDEGLTDSIVYVHGYSHRRNTFVSDSIVVASLASTYVVISKDKNAMDLACTTSPDTSKVPVFLGIATSTVFDTFRGAFFATPRVGSIGGLSGYVTISATDTIGIQNGPLYVGADSVGSINTGYFPFGGMYEEYLYDISLTGRVFDTSLVANLTTFLPGGGKVINIKITTTHVDYDTGYGMPYYKKFNVPVYHPEGYTSGRCDYAPGLHYRYQDTCTVPSLPDTITVGGYTYHNLRTMSADSFIMVYNASVGEGKYAIAEALLPLHPQYCELQNCFDDTFKTLVTALPDWHVAQSLNMLMLDSLVAHDPILPMMVASGMFPSPRDSLRTFEGGLFALDTFILMNAYCSSSDDVMFATCASGMFAYEISHHSLINDQVRAYYFAHMANVYFSNRQHYVDELLMRGSPYCSHCALARMTLDNSAVLNPAPYPLGFTGVSTDTTGLEGSTWLAGVLRDSNLTVYDSVLFARMQDTVKAFTTTTGSNIAYACVDSIVAQLSNCWVGNTMLALGIRDTLRNTFMSGSAPSGNFTPAQIRYAITSNGIAVNDICNQYLINCYQFGSPPTVPVADCLADSFYSGISTALFHYAFYFTTGIRGSGSPYSLDTVTNYFERSIGRALGNVDFAVIYPSYDAARDLYEMDFTWAGYTVRAYFHMAGCGDFFGTVAAVSANTECINSDPALAGTAGLIGGYAFTSSVSALYLPLLTTASCTITGWIDSIPTMAPRNNDIAACTPCAEIRSLYLRFADTLAADSVYGADHPYYSTMLTNFMNAALGRQYTAYDYKTFIQSCALADSAVIPLYTGYSTFTFSTRPDVDTFITALNAVDPVYNFDNSYRDSNTVSHTLTVCVDLNRVPATNLWMYKGMLSNYTHGYTSRMVNMPLSSLQPAGEIGFMYMPTGYSFNPADSGIIDTAKASFVSSNRAVWMGGDFQMQQFWDVVAKPGYKPVTISNDAYLLADYMEKIPGAVFFPSDQHTIDADYFKLQKKAFLAYNYSYQRLPVYQVLDSIEARYLTARIPSWSGYTAAYGQSYFPGMPSGLYISDASMNNRYYDTLQTVINHAGTGGNIFYTVPATNVPLATPMQLDAYLCADGSYWYRYFTTGDTLFNVYVGFPPYIPKTAHSLYHVAGPVIPVPYDSLNRSFVLNVTRTGSADTIQVYGRTSFTIGHSIELDNVLLGNDIVGTTAAAAADTFDNCERQRLYSYTEQGTINYRNYIDSVHTAVRSDFLAYLAGGVQETLKLGYWNDEFSYTLYNYDREGNLMLTVSPAGTNPIANTGSVLNDVDTMRANDMTSSPTTPLPAKINTYQYNSGNQVATQQTVDGYISNFYYDVAGRLVFSQNAQQAIDKRFTYNIYDKQGRIIETGEKPYSGSFMPADARMSNHLPISVVTAIPSNGSTDRYDVVRTIYDTAAADLSAITGLDAQQNLRKRVSCVKYFDTLYSTDPDYTGYKHASHYSYDIEGNVQCLVQDMPMLGDATIYGDQGAMRQRYKRIDYDYDVVSGKVNMLSYNRGVKDQFYQKYQYDALNRITNVQTSNDGYVWQEEAKYAYYQHGPLARTTLCNPYVQGLDYAYTIQGWLKSLNNDTISTQLDMGHDGSDISTTMDAAAYTLEYFHGDYSDIGKQFPGTPFGLIHSLYNGNIAAQKAAIDPFRRLYKEYVYDQLNRIREANYSTFDISGPTAIQDYKSHYRYDGDGNITELVRYGNNTGSGAQLMDSLEYSYGFHNNILRELYDYSPDNYTVPHGQQDVANFTAYPTLRYVHNIMGNCIADLVSGQDTIEWTMYNKVKRTVNTTDGNNIRYGYDGAGNRVFKKYTKFYNGLYANQDRVDRSDYYVRDAQGNVLAIYHAIDTFTAPSSSYQLAAQHFSLAEHDIYGSARLGLRKYFWEEAGINYNSAASPALADTSLWHHKPWYSAEYQDVIKPDSLKLYGNTFTDSVQLSGISGLRQYEITDHLGDVIASVSDIRVPAIMTTSLGGGTSARVLSWRPFLTSLFDYYPFGQYMPGPYGGDSNAQCYTTLRPGASSTVGVSGTFAASALVPGAYSLIGSATFTPVVGGGGVMNLQTNTGGDGIHINLDPVAPGVPQTMNVSMSYMSPNTFFNVNVVDGSTGAYIAGITLHFAFPVSPIVNILFTPPTSSIALEITEGGFIIGGGGGGVPPPPHSVYLYGYTYDTVSLTTTMITTTICTEDGYEYGHNGQMKVNDIAGLGNHYSAKFWEYDPRTARRWNVDPIMKPYRSSYDAFDNSPIWKMDPEGDDDYYNRYGKYVGSDGAGTAIRLFNGYSVTQFSNKLAEIGSTEMKATNREISVQSDEQFNAIMKDIKTGSTRDNYEHKAYIILNADPEHPTLGLEAQPRSAVDDDQNSENVFDGAHYTDPSTGTSANFKTVSGDANKVIVGQVHGHPDKKGFSNNQGTTTYGSNELLPKTSKNDKKVAEKLGVPVYGADYTDKLHKVDPSGKTSNVAPDKSILTGSLEQTGGKPQKESDNAPGK